MALEPGPMIRTPFGMLPDKGKRFYAVGGILTHVSATVSGVLLDWLLCVVVGGSGVLE